MSNLVIIILNDLGKRKWNFKPEKLKRMKIAVQVIIGCINFGILVQYAIGIIITKKK
jgi:hypothetical protein